MTTPETPEVNLETPVCFHSKVCTCHVTVRSKVSRPSDCVHESYHRRERIWVHADGGPRGADDPGDGVQRLTDVDVEVWRAITLFHRFV